MSKHSHSFDPNADQAASNPRAFAQGVGRVCQVWGVLMICVMCCGWALSADLFRSLGPAGPDAPSWQESFLAGELGWRDILMGLAIVLPIALGFGFGGAGIGLVGQRPSAGWFALILAVIQWLLWAALLTANIATAPTVAGVATAGAFLLLSTVLLGLTWAAVVNLRRHPPPPGMTRLPEWVKEPKSYLNPDKE